MIDKMVPIRFTFMTWPPLLLVVFLPNVWWGILVKVLAVLWLLGLLRAAFGPGFSEVQGFGATGAPWDVLHPGRPWAERLQPGKRTVAEIVAGIEQFLAKRGK